MNGAICGVYRKTLTDTFKLFKSMLQSFLPGFSSSLGAVPKSYAGRPTKTIYFHHSFQYMLRNQVHKNRFLATFTQKRFSLCNAWLGFILR